MYKSQKYISLVVQSSECIHPFRHCPERWLIAVVAWQLWHASYGANGLLWIVVHCNIWNIVLFLQKCHFTKSCDLKNYLLSAEPSLEIRGELDFKLPYHLGDNSSLANYSIAAEPKIRALFHKSIKLSTQILLLVTCFFDIQWYLCIQDTLGPA